MFELLISAPAAVAILALGYLAGRVHHRPMGVCPCGHAWTYHEAGTGPCYHQRGTLSPLCSCRIYGGLEPMAAVLERHRTTA